MAHAARPRTLVLVFALLWVPILGLAANEKSPTKQGSGFEIHVVVTTNGRELFKTWNSGARQPFHIDAVKVAERGPFLSAVVLFNGCRANSNGDCDVDLDIVAYDPTGKLYGEIRGAELWKGKPAPPPGYTQLGMDYMGIVIEPHDPSGTYRIVAVARDRIGHSEASSTATFEVK